MGAFSFWHIMVVALLAVMLFGRGKVSDLMGDVAKGIKSFKRGLAEDEAPRADAPMIGQQTGAVAPVAARDATRGA